MGANKYEAFETMVVKRSQVAEAEYNPRKISDGAKKKLQRFLKKNGLWSPLIMNKRTGRLVSGHQRMAILDTLLQSADYDITMAVVDVDEKTEVSGNVFMNNQSATGEWDYEVLGQLGDMFEGIDFEKDFGFDGAEVSLFMPSENTMSIDDEPTEPVVTPSVPEPSSKEEKPLTIRDLQRDNRAQAKQKIEDGRDYYMHDADFTVTMIFTSASQKRAFMRALNQPESEKRVVFPEFEPFLNFKLNV